MEEIGLQGVHVPPTFDIAASLGPGNLARGWKYKLYIIVHAMYIKIYPSVSGLWKGLILPKRRVRGEITASKLAKNPIEILLSSVLAT